MPRLKPVPVRRGVDRFHESAVDKFAEDEAVVEVDEQQTESNASDHPLLIVDRDTQPTGVLPRNLTDIVIGVKDSVDRNEWKLMGVKTLARACMHHGKLHLVLHDGALLCTSCSECSDDTLVVQEKVGVYLGRLLLECIHQKVLMFSLHLGAGCDGKTLLMTVHLSKSCTSLPPPVLRWILLEPSSYTTGDVAVDDNFSASGFLTEIAASFRGSVNNDELRCTLGDAGIRTEMRNYQLQGVQWMHDRLSGAPVLDGDVAQYLQGWIRLPKVTTTNTGTSSSTSHGSSAAASSCWYNIHTEAVYFGATPVSADLQDADESQRGLILADEMGVGKSLQIIALVSLLKANAVHDATRVGGSMAADDAAAGKGRDVLDGPQRTCLCGSADDLPLRSHGEYALLGWVQCSSCDTWLHAPCAGFQSAEALEACDVYTCLACSCLQTYHRPIPTRTTLIVMPNTLIAQWRAELLKHTATVTFNNPHAPAGLKVFIYPENIAVGEGFSGGKGAITDYGRLDPRTLAHYDIILLSFRALQKGYHEANVDYSSERIRRSIYAIFPPPFLCLRYHLLVVDETQNIEAPSGSSQTLNMACRIPSQHRISVSGTPLGTGRLSDLHSLSMFLRIEPLCQRSIWSRLIERPVVPVPALWRVHVLQSLFGAITIRRTKDMIREQLALPRHSVVTHILQFSTFERALYEEKLGENCNALLDAQYQQDRGGSSSSSAGTLDLTDAKARLEHLRKGCCHPQVLDATLARHGRSAHTRHGDGGNGTRSGKPKSSTNAAAAKAEITGPRPLDEIMVARVEQSRLQCEDLQRSLLFHLFSLAGAATLQAQCCILSLPPYAELAQRGDGAASRHLVRAHCAYRLALSLIQSNRSLTALVGTARIHGDDTVALTVLRPGVGAVHAPPGGVRVPIAQEGLDLRWLVPFQTVMGRETTAVVTPVSWKPVTRPSLSVVPSASSAPRDPHALPISDIVGSAQGLSAQLTFTSSRRIMGMSISNETPDLHELRGQSAALGMQGSGENNCLVLLQPAEVALQVAMGSSDVYADVSTVTLLSNASSIRIPESAMTGGINSSTHRAKRWRLRVVSIQSYCCVIRHTLVGGQVSLQCAWLPCDQLAAFVSHLNAGHQPGAAPKVSVQLGLSVQLQETAMDADALQELHACYNIGAGTQLLAIDGKQERLQRYRALVQDTEQSLGIPSGPSGMVQVGAALKRLQNRTHFDTANSVIPTVTTVAADPWLPEEVQRADVIEKQFLEAAAGRRVAADMSLSEALHRTDERDSEIATLLAPPQLGFTQGSSASSGPTKPHGRTHGSRMWWNELLLYLEGDSRFSAALQASVEQGEAAYRRLGNVSTMTGVQYVLGEEWGETERTRAAAIKVLSTLSKTPTEAEIAESTDCQTCRHYFGKTGPTCAHCRKKETLREYANHVICYRRQNKRVVAHNSSSSSSSANKKARTGQDSSGGNAGLRALLYEDNEGLDGEDFEVRAFDEGAVDSMVLMVLKLLRPHAGAYHMSLDEPTEPLNPTAATPQRSFKEVCALEIRRQEGLRAEVEAMMAAWERYSDLLKAYDELVQSKTRLGLIIPSLTSTTASSEGKGKSKKKVAPVATVAALDKPAEGRDIATAAQLHPYELQPTLDTALASAVQADAALRKGMSGLQFYKEQVREVFAEMHQLAEEAREPGDHDEEGPVVLVEDGGDDAEGGGSPRSTCEAKSDEHTTPIDNPTLPAAANLLELKSAMRTPTATCLICRDRLFVPTPKTPAKPRGHSPPEDSQAEKVVVLPCAHRYHEDCVTGWVKKHKTCPLCKAAVTVKDLLTVGQYAEPKQPKQAPQQLLDALAGHPSASLPPISDERSGMTHLAVQELSHQAGLRVLESHDQTLSKDTTLSSGSSSATAVAATSTVAPTAGPTLAAGIITAGAAMGAASRVRLVGMWGTKVDRLVTDLLQLVADPNHAEEKAIVFSQWTEMVDIVSEALRANKLAYVKCSNRSKDFSTGGGLESFRNDPSVRVLVMPLGLGAEGLDLIVASHVFLLEPLLNVHQELQAVNRIHRMGQQKPTFVHKYMLQGTIEERIVHVQERQHHHTDRDSREDSAQDTVGHPESPIASTRKGKVQRDDDQLSEDELRYILHLPAARVLGQEIVEVMDLA